MPLPPNGAEAITDAVDITDAGTRPAPVVVAWDTTAKAGARTAEMDTLAEKTMVWHKVYVPVAGTGVFSHRPVFNGATEVAAPGDAFMYVFTGPATVTEDDLAAASMTPGDTTTVMALFTYADEDAGENKGSVTTDVTPGWYYIASGAYNTGATLAGQYLYVSLPTTTAGATPTRSLRFSPAPNGGATIRQYDIVQSRTGFDDALTHQAPAFDLDTGAELGPYTVPLISDTEEIKVAVYAVNTHGRSQHPARLTIAVPTPPAGPTP